MGFVKAAVMVTKKEEGGKRDPFFIFDGGEVKG